jgi:Protein of unknown function (DUF4235)
MAKLAYRPFGLLFSVLGGLLAGAVFKQVWKRVSDKEDPPKPKQSEYVGVSSWLPPRSRARSSGSRRQRSTEAARAPSRRSPAPGRATKPLRRPVPRTPGGLRMLGHGIASFLIRKCRRQVAALLDLLALAPSPDPRATAAGHAAGADCMVALGAVDLRDRRRLVGG